MLLYAHVNADVFFMRFVFIYLMRMPQTLRTGQQAIRQLLQTNKLN